MARFIPLSTLGQTGAAAGGADFDWTRLLKLLKPAGAAANLAGFSNVGGALGGLGALAGVGSALAGGNPASAVGALPSLLSTAGSMLGATSPAITAMATGAAAPALGTTLGALGAGLGPAMLMMMPAYTDLGGADFFDLLFGGAKSQAQKQHEEHAGYRQAFPGLVQRRQQGAGLFDDLDTFDTPESIEDALRTAHSGVTATDLSPAYSHLKQAPYDAKSPMAANIPGMDMAWWEEMAPGLEGENWASYIGLGDKATNAGLDLDAIIGDRDRQTAMGQGHVFAGPGGVNVDADPNGMYSGSAYDLSNAIAGIGGQLGIDWGSRGDERAGENQGYTLQDDQLGEYGFTEGQQGPAILNYLRNLDAGVLEDEDFDRYATALGTTRDAVMAMPTFTPTPRNRPQNPLLMDFGWGPSA
jgi:hypothetical protein